MQRIVDVGACSISSFQMLTPHMEAVEKNEEMRANKEDIETTRLSIMK